MNRPARLVCGCCAAVILCVACGGGAGGLPGGGKAMDAAADARRSTDAGGNVDANRPRDASNRDTTTGDATPSMDAARGDATSDAPLAAEGGCGSQSGDDNDGDGWTVAQGDCNDCDPNINPGAVDLPRSVGSDGGLLPGVDSDCDGQFDPPAPCDTGLALDDIVADDGAKAIELCQFTTEAPATPRQRTWGVISAAYVRANGAMSPSPGLQVGIEEGWGTNVRPQGGQNVLALSSGHARTSGQSGACGSNSCETNATGTAPVGFPQDNPSCHPAADIADDVALEVKVRVPTNATGYSFDFKFYSMEFPYYVCDSYNDQFIALVSPAPTGAINGNIAFDSHHAPVSVNLGFFDVCDASRKALYAVDCQMNAAMTCPSPPNPYCPSGTAELAGTGFDAWNVSLGGSGATSWLRTQAPAQGGSEVTIRFAIWDTGDQDFDSSVIVDNFKWITSSGPVVVSTDPISQPQ